MRKLFYWNSDEDYKPDKISNDVTNDSLTKIDEIEKTIQKIILLYYWQQI